MTNDHAGEIVKLTRNKSLRFIMATTHQTLIFEYTSTILVTFTDFVVSYFSDCSHISDKREFENPQIIMIFVFFLFICW